jgi:hypothetical protein
MDCYGRAVVSDRETDRAILAALREARAAFDAGDRSSPLLASAEIAELADRSVDHARVRLRVLEQTGLIKESTAFRGHWSALLPSD